MKMQIDDDKAAKAKEKEEQHQEQEQETEEETEEEAEMEAEKGFDLDKWRDSGAPSGFKGVTVSPSGLFIARRKKGGSRAVYHEEERLGIYPTAELAAQRFAEAIVDLELSP